MLRSQISPSKVRSQLQDLPRQASQALADLQRLNSKAAVAARPDHNRTQFHALRSVLRLSAEELPRGARPARSLSGKPEQAAARLRAIASDLRRYRKNLRQRVQTAAAQRLGPSRSERIILRYLERDMEDQPTQTALTANLRHPDYVQILCSTLDQLPYAFPELDRQTSSRPPHL